METERKKYNIKNSSWSIITILIYSLLILLADKILPLTELSDSEYYVSLYNMVEKLHEYKDYRLFSVGFFVILFAALILKIFNTDYRITMASAFVFPVFLSVSFAIWPIVLMEANIQIEWLILYLSFLLPIFTKISYNRIANISGQPTKSVRKFFSYLKENKTKINQGSIDYYFLVVARIILLVVWIVLSISFVITLMKYSFLFDF